MKLSENNGINPTFSIIYLYESMNQYRAMEGYLVQPSGTTWRIFDSHTGIPLFNMTGVLSGFEGGFFGGSGTGVVGEYGGILTNQLNVNGKWLAFGSSFAESNTSLVSTSGNTTIIPILTSRQKRRHEPSIPMEHNHTRITRRLNNPKSYTQ